MVINNGVNNQFFLLEIAASASSPRSLSVAQRSGTMVLKVPANRLSQEFNRLHRLGFSIVGVYPTTLISSSHCPDWWIEIYTEYPRCLYYFGPFSSHEEADAEQRGFVEDLQKEGAEHIGVNIKQCQPPFLTQEW